MSAFEMTLTARWGDMDFNSHLANTAFLDHAVDVRLAFFASCGFPAKELMAHGIGPVVQEDKIRYMREIRLQEKFRVQLRCGGLSQDGARFIICNDFYREDDVHAAALVTQGGWLDLRERKLTVPPEALRKALEALERTPEFLELPSLSA
ncbi:MAG: acyl-CoA thioesterase [Arenimonas sp.]